MRFTDSTFQGGTVPLDGSQFVKCRFVKTVLVFAGTAPTSLEDCVFIDTSWQFDGPAALTLAFLSGMYQGAGDGGRKVVEVVFDQIRGVTQTAVASRPPADPVGA